MVGYGPGNGCPERAGDEMIFSDIHNVNIICGHYGSGKTNVAVNMALAAREAFPDRKITVADLDIVNPYFRAADNARMLRDAGIEVAVPDYANSNVDIPLVPHGMASVLTDGISFLDVGGDDGAVVLGMYARQISEGPYDMFYVINGNRPLIREPADALSFMRDIERVSGLRCTKIINNTSLGRETEPRDVLAGIEYAEDCSKLCGIPIAAHTYCPEYTGQIAPPPGIPLVGIRDITKKLF